MSLIFCCVLFFGTVLYFLLFPDGFSWCVEAKNVSFIRYWTASCILHWYKLINADNSIHLKGWKWVALNCLNEEFSKKVVNACPQTGRNIRIKNRHNILNKIILMATLDELKIQAFSSILWHKEEGLYSVGYIKYSHVTSKPS